MAVAFHISAATGDEMVFPLDPVTADSDIKKIFMK